MNTLPEITKDNFLSHLIALPFIIAIALFRPAVIFVIWNWLGTSYFEVSSITFIQSICLVAFFDIVSKSFTLTNKSK